jgi:hypothetical protein
VTRLNDVLRARVKLSEAAHVPGSAVASQASPLTIQVIHEGGKISHLH